jgi:hypothetical protein
LKGNYSENFQDFEIPELGIVEVVDGTSFKFIVELKFGEDDDEFEGGQEETLLVYDLGKDSIHLQNN